MKMFKGWKRKGFLGIGVLVLALLFCFGMNQSGEISAADEEGKILIGGKEFTGDYILTESKVSVRYTDYSTVNDTIQWIPDNKEVITISEADENGIKTYYINAAGVGTAVLECFVNGEWVASCTIKIESAFIESSIFEPASDISEKSIVVLDLDINKDGEEVSMLFPAEDVTWKSKNLDVVEIVETTPSQAGIPSKAKIKPVGTGKGTIEVTYMNSESKRVGPYSFDVYVAPKVTVQTEQDDSSTADVLETDSGFLVYPGVTAASGDNIKTKTSDKVDWVLKKDDKIVASSDEPQQILVTGDKNDPDEMAPYWTINAKAGLYSLDIATKGCLDKSVGALKKNYKIRVYATPDDIDSFLQKGDVFDLAKAFNITTGEFGGENNFFTGGPVSSDEFDANAVDYNESDGTVKIVKDTKKISFTLTPTEFGKKYIRNYDGETYTITLTVYSEFTLNFTDVDLVLNGEAVNLEAYYNNERTKNVKWSIAEENKKYVQLDEKEGYISGVGVTSTPVKVTASITLEDGRTLNATCTVRVHNTATSITLTPDELELKVGGFNTVVADVELISDGADGTASPKLVWLIEDEEIASIKSITDDTLSATIEGLKAGHTTITVINSENYKVAAYCTVTVVAPIESITISSESATVYLFQEAYKLSVIATEPAELINTATFKWSTNAPEIAEVSDSGLVKLKKAGKVIVKVEAEYDPFVFATCELTIEEHATGFGIKNKTITIEAGQKYDVEYDVAVDVASTTVKWELTDTTVAKLGQPQTAVVKGNKPKQTITGTKAGVTYIVATTSEGLVSTCKVVVIEKASGVSVTPTKLELAVGESQKVTATAVPATATDTVFTWISEKDNIASVSNGTVTGKAPGTTIIWVTPQNGSGRASVVVTVYSKATGMTFENTNIEIVKGEKYTIKPVFSPANVTNKGVKYTSLNTSVATVDSSGVIKALKGGTTVITGVSDDGGHIATCVVTVKERITTLKLDHKNVNLGLGKKLKLKATVTSNSASNPKLKWTTSNKDIVKVNQKGKIKGKKIGTATITVRVTDGSNKKATCKVRVVRGVTSVTLNKRVLNVVVGQTEKLKATIKPTNATVKSVTWTCDNPEIAVVENGEILGLAIGSTKVTATAKDSSGKKATCYVNVIEEIPVSSIVLSAQNMTMVKGEAQRIGYSVTPHNTTDKVYFDSDNRAVATVTGDGKVYARRAGVANISITTTSGKQAMVKVMVIGLNKTKVTMEQYDTETLYVDGATSGVTWFTSNPSVATVQNGKITARKAGTCTVYAKINGINLACTVVVKNMTK